MHENTSKKCVVRLIVYGQVFVFDKLIVSLRLQYKRCEKKKLPLMPPFAQQG